MAERYHINPETGRANICRATVRACPVGGTDGKEAPHFDTKEEARTYYEQQQEAQRGGSLTTVSKKEPSQKVIETTAARLQPGDQLAGEKFVNGEWVNDDSAPIVAATSYRHPDYGQVVEVLREDGHYNLYQSNSRINVKPATTAPEPKERLHVAARDVQKGDILYAQKEIQGKEVATPYGIIESVDTFVHQEYGTVSKVEFNTGETGLFFPDSQALVERSKAPEPDLPYNYISTTAQDLKPGDVIHDANVGYWDDEGTTEIAAVDTTDGLTVTYRDGSKQKFATTENIRVLRKTEEH